MSAESSSALRLRFAEALRSACFAKRVPSAALEEITRSHARARRLAGDDIASALVDVKTLVQDCTEKDEPIFTPKVVGWTVAGFFHGSARE